jgi:hypothetical protein
VVLSHQPFPRRALARTQRTHDDGPEIRELRWRLRLDRGIHFPKEKYQILSGKASLLPILLKIQQQRRNYDGALVAWHRRVAFFLCSCNIS